jgi:hypothetical protein
LKGKTGFRFGDREEIYEAGEAFYVPPGHAPVGYAGGEMVMSSRPTRWRGRLRR